ncbi:YncE family protein [Mucilaginibacter limnophilus]|uniref:YncE family protein n=1 Tax=Mucilaginibacter limnophilus TaxID=1932778 RepID=UPI00197BE0B8|nr:YncE family protein [Mucilaginibacter limnophilus]
MKKLMFLFLVLPLTKLSAQDRVYTGNQISNTVSVIDPKTQTFLGDIVLGKPQPEILSPLYKGQALVHGLGYSPKRQLLAAVSIGSNSVTFISTPTNKVLKTIYVGRSPHEATFNPSGSQAWISVRGEAYISVIDAATMKEIKQVKVADGPGMVSFTPNGKWAYVCSSFTPRLDIVNTATYQVVKSIPVVSPFSPNIFCSPDGKWIALTHKDIGKVTLINTATNKIEKVFNTGPITNHVTFTVTNKVPLMLVTVGGENTLKIFNINQGFILVDSIATGSLPHGVWPSGDGKFAYVGLENDDQVQVVDLLKMAIVKTIPIGQCPQALLYAVNAGPVTPVTTGLSPLNAADKSQVIKLKSTSAIMPTGMLNIRSVGLTDLVQQDFKKLEPNTAYTLALTNSIQQPYNADYVINSFKTDDKGTFSGQSTGIIKTVGKTMANYKMVILIKDTNKVTVMTGQ